MSDDIYLFLSNIDRHPAATTSVIYECEKQLGTALPKEYVDFLKVSNGGEGFIGKNAYVMLWSAEELTLMDNAYEVQKYAPGLLLFGSNGSGEAYGFDTRPPQWLIVQIPFVGMDWNYAEPIGHTFGEFLKHLYEAP